MLDADTQKILFTRNSDDGNDHSSEADDYDQNNNEEEESSSMITWIWLFLLSGTLIFLFVYMWHQSKLHSSREDDDDSGPSKPKKSKKLDRLILAEQNLFTRRVRAHDQFCRQCRSVDESNLDHECPICYEDIKVGCLVSWSTNKECSHVFHHSCLKHWCMRKTGCPFCRHTLLVPDHEDQTDDIEEGREKRPSQELFDETNNLCFYCVEHGVSRFTEDELATLSTVDPESLKGEHERDVPSQQELEVSRPILRKRTETKDTVMDTGSEADAEDPETAPNSSGSLTASENGDMGNNTIEDTSDLNDQV